ncbi:MAG: chorismate-binding protein, partial [Bacteroidetes bacterium]|nr:chorismate-binding protein [Bacteroidota bacterium]
MSYDLKNSIESFLPKNNNPLQFPDTLFVEIEKTISYQDLQFNAPDKPDETINLKQTVTKEQYINRVNELKAHIQQGDIYEINYCLTFEATNVRIDPLTIYQKLNAISQASYAALIKLDTQYIICSSPELFLSKKANRLI